ncbi:DoxX family protein [Mesorhizobium sp. Root157]|uniref:DoxX family protein n=1 Tax=Mesorhizobium sp. Root157 TaxID=1736477 RepID=UPI0006F257D0|nr:DoxX family protein [Mesorhizobium sp. Root157]KQZ96283.1 DoxX family protein [Mesorhizobium sp. Root157]
MSNLPEMTSSPMERLILPFMAPFYHQFAQPAGWLVFRVIIGGLLMVEGWPKIIAPFAQTGFVEGLGLYPGWFFSPMLAVMQFVGGFFIVIGLLTRPVALANALMLAVTIWFHVTRPYGDAFLTPEGIEFLKSNLQYLTDQGQARLLSDGGGGFLHQVQAKAEFNSTFWTAGAAIIAAFGGGTLSLDRRIGREF